MVVAAGKKVMAASPESSDGGVRTENVRERHLAVAIRILAEYADAWMCPAALLAEIVEQGQVSFQTMSLRRDRAKAGLVAAAETRLLAEQLLNDLSGAAVKLPKLPRTTISQAELLVAALTE
jgi:hypothetical protein